MNRFATYPRITSAALSVVFACCATGTCTAQDANSATGNALQTLFNPSSASAANTMGLLQRSNFIDRIAGKRGRLEIALVVDATESMQEQLVGIQEKLQQMLGDIRRVVGDEVYVQLVVYRDYGAPSGSVSWPMGKAFTRDADAIEAGLKKLVPETGAPYFLEAVDQGLHAALTELPWNQDLQTTRWLLVIGDAPPFDRGFSEPDNGAERKHSTEQLIQLAQTAGIEIHAILCPSRQEDQAIYSEVVGLTRFFFGELTSQTGGLMLDLSDPELLANVASAAKTTVSDFTAIEPITTAELEDVRSRANRDRVSIAPDQRVRIAVLPHLSIEAMSFSRRNPAVRFADEMRSQLELAGLNVELVSHYELERTFYKLPLEGVGRDAVLQQVGLGVAADYVIWGAMVDGQPDKVQSGILDAKTGRFIVRIPSINTQFPARANLSSAVLNALAQESKTAGRPIQLASVRRKFRTRLVANTEEVERLTLSARGMISTAMHIELGEGESNQLFDAAEADLLQAIQLEPDNPITNALLANVYFNQFKILKSQNDAEAGNKRRSAIDFAGAAMRSLSRVLETDQLEIQADFHFYRGDFEEAAALYEQMTQRAETVDQMRRARWMLAGIYSGDWGIAKNAPHLVEARKARQEVVQLLAFFEDSPEARMLKKYLMWDDSRGGTLNANLPLAQVEIPQH